MKTSNIFAIIMMVFVGITSISYSAPAEADYTSRTKDRLVKQWKDIWNPCRKWEGNKRQYNNCYERIEKKQRSKNKKTLKSRAKARKYFLSYHAKQTSYANKRDAYLVKGAAYTNRIAELETSATPLTKAEQKSLKANKYAAKKAYRSASIYDGKVKTLSPKLAAYARSYKAYGGREDLISVSQDRHVNTDEYYQ